LTNKIKQLKFSTKKSSSLHDEMQTAEKQSKLNSKTIEDDFNALKVDDDKSKRNFKKVIDYKLEELKRRCPNYKICNGKKHLNGHSNNHYM
jgi:hypothetical protein